MNEWFRSIGIECSKPTFKMSEPHHQVRAGRKNPEFSDFFKGMPSAIP